MTSSTAPTTVEENTSSLLSPAESTADGTLAQAAIGRIIGLIRSGELAPGGIVNEVDLAKRFDMSRGPVREAVRNLEGRKLIVREAYQRARIVQLGIKQVQELFELRECLEGMACRLATARMTDLELDELVESFENKNNSATSPTIFTEDFNFSFHKRIVSFCGNKKIEDVLTSEVYELVRLYRWTRRAAPGRSGRARTEHWQIAKAMQSRDEDLAESLMRSHIQRSMQIENLRIDSSKT